MIAECRKIALVFDNCPAHPKEINPKLKNVTVFYLPPNTTSEKCYSFLLATKHYIKTAANGSTGDKKFQNILSQENSAKVITALEDNQSMPKNNLWGSISEISKAWDYDVTDSTIRNSFVTKLDSLSAMRLRQIRRTKTIFP
ncbi:hypothetical protein AVEN_115007-1 [Araneus ventricosus]|uniref:DDE-1 domain-containing protein n=1 Tax=Araneus ventricosus TaxID=182803 RepID=A0A4Y1ZWU6_ARAVE|nr:hypothetical protein AVEN_115007-1 [Araneus ventricosus]